MSAMLIELRCQPAARQSVSRVAQTQSTPGARARVLCEPLESRSLLSVTYGDPDADGWIVDDKYPVGGANGAAANAMVVDAAGDLFSSGNFADAAGITHGTIRMKAASPGATWQQYAVFDNIAINGLYTYESGGTQYLMAVGQKINLAPTETRNWVVLKGSVGQQMSIVDEYLLGNASAIAGTPDGSEIYVTGITSATVTVNGQPTKVNCWTVRKSSNGGAIWQDSFQYYQSGKATNGRALVVAPSGVYTVGDSGGCWMTWRNPTGADGDWTCVDRVQPDPNKFCYGYGIGVDKNGAVYTTGEVVTSVYQGRKAMSNHKWTIRRIRPDGTTWDTVDEFQLAGPGYAARATGFGADAQGNLYAVGYAQDPNTGVHWIVRASPMGDKDTWSTINDWQMVAGQPSRASTIVADQAGNLYVGGNATEPVTRTTSKTYWIVKELPSPASSFQSVLSAQTTTFATVPHQMPFSTTLLRQRNRLLGPDLKPGTVFA